MQLHQLKPAPGSRPPKRIVGRGEGSTLGQTCGKGQKGQTCRSGDGKMIGFEGGQMPLMRRMPKRGFRHASKIYYQPINIQTLEAIFDKGADVNGQALHEKGLINTATAPFKILGKGKITKAFKVTTSAISKSAGEAIKKAGGSVSAPSSK